jgi:F-type H+-transporting ATPase subunit b
MIVATLLIAAQEEAPPPLIDIDGTLIVQFVLFLIMLIVLTRVLFRPYLSLRDARHKGIEGARHEAEQLTERAGQVNADYEGQRVKARQRGNEERQKLRTEGAAHERQVLGAARDEAGKALETARARIASESAAARTQLQTEATTLSRQIVTKILGREVA